VRKVAPDREMAASILRMVEVRMKALEQRDRIEFASLVVEDYYEIIKECITAIMLIDGYKTLSHEVLIGYLYEFFPEFSAPEIALLDQLRIVRNKISYKGFFVEPDFLERNEKRMKELMLKTVATLKHNTAGRA
jgi:hypothetical protein